MENLEQQAEQFNKDFNVGDQIEVFEGKFEAISYGIHDSLGFDTIDAQAEIVGNVVLVALVNYGLADIRQIQKINRGISTPNKVDDAFDENSSTVLDALMFDNDLNNINEDIQLENITDDQPQSNDDSVEMGGGDFGGGGSSDGW